MTIKEYVAYRKALLTDQIKDLEIKPHLMIIQINDDPASQAYVKGKLKDCAEVGILFFLILIFTLFYFTILYWFCHTLT